jgi:hypothetical protein
MPALKGAGNPGCVYGVRRLNRRGEVQPCESERLSQVSFALGTSAAFPRIDFEHYVPGEVPLGQILQYPTCLLVAATGHQVFVLD